MSDKNSGRPKLGAGHAQAMARLGLAELREAFNPSHDSIARHPESGLYGTALPSEVAAQKGADVQKESGDGRSTLDDRMTQAPDKTEPVRDDREREERDGPERE